MEGGRPGIIYHVNDVSVYLGRQRGEGSLVKRTHFAHAFFVLNQERYAFHLIHEHSKLQCLGQKLQDQGSTSFFRLGTPPPSV